jgi:hypothetical protein
MELKIYWLRSVSVNGGRAFFLNVDKLLPDYTVFQTVSSVPDYTLRNKGKAIPVTGRGGP